MKYGFNDSINFIMNKILPIILVVVLSGCSSDFFWTEEDHEQWRQGYEMGYDAEDSDDYSRYESDSFIDGYEYGQHEGDCEDYQLREQWDKFSQEECEKLGLVYPDGIKSPSLKAHSCSIKFKPNEVWHNCLGYKDGIHAKFKKGFADGYGTQRFQDGIYTGEFKRSVWNGAGKLAFNDGTYLIGNFKHGKLHGKISFYNNQNELMSSKNYNHGKEIVSSASRTNPKDKANDEFKKFLDLLYLLQGY